MLRILEKFQGWDYYTYESQPAFFIDSIANYLQAESMYKKDQ